MVVELQYRFVQISKPVTGGTRSHPGTVNSGWRLAGLPYCSAITARLGMVERLFICKILLNLAPCDPTCLILGDKWHNPLISTDFFRSYRGRDPLSLLESPKESRGRRFLEHKVECFARKQHIPN